MAIKRMIKRKIRTMTTGVNHYSDEPVDATNEVSRKLDEVNDKLDVKTAQSQEAGPAGVVGTMRIIRDASEDGELYYLEFKTADGWIRSDNTSVSGFSIRNKSA